MANIKNSKIIRIYGVTLPKSGQRPESYGHGATKDGEALVAYVDYFIKHLVWCIKKAGLEKEIIKKLK